MYRKSLIRLGAIRRATFPKGKAYCIRNLARKSEFEIQSNTLMPRSWLDLGSILGGSPPVANVVREDFDEVECPNRRVLPAAGSALLQVLPANFHIDITGKK